MDHSRIEDQIYSSHGQLQHARVAITGLHLTACQMSIGGGASDYYLNNVSIGAFTAAACGFFCILFSRKWWACTRQIAKCCTMDNKHRCRNINPFREELISDAHLLP
ncbi:hypothetical protein V6N13_048062 [Hibiscus sabdariffa]|uniref:Uncharacterized protein n=1 Tax=Hibiscus sabdariffa TaxID=183260 RepID=A0ABR2F619_9ROSI